MTETAPRTRIRRNAAPFVPPPKPRTRTRGAAAQPVAVTGLVTGIVEIDQKRGTEQVRLEREVAKANRRLPETATVVAQVTVKGGVTLSPVQYESIRIEVSLSLPSAPEPEAYEAAFTEASDLVASKIAQQIAGALPDA